MTVKAAKIAPPTMLPSTMTAIVSHRPSLRTMPSAPRAQLIGAMLAPAQIHICCGPVESLSASGMGSMLWTSTLSSARASVVMLAHLAFGSGLVELSEETKIRASPVPARYCAAHGEAVKIRDGCQSRLTLTVRSTTAAVGAKTLDGFSRVMHNRFNQDIPAAITVQEGEAVQFLCRDALDIGTAARSLTPNGILTLDLAKVHPLTGPVSIEGAEPGDMLEVEILDVAPLVDFGYVTIGPVLGLFGSLQPDILAPFHAFTEASQLSDPTPGKVTGAIPDTQPFNTGAPFVQIFTFNKGQNTGFASFVGKDTGRKAQIPIAPFMGIYGVAPLRKGMYRTVPPNVSGGMGGNTDIKQFTKGSKIYYPVY